MSKKTLCKDCLQHVSRPDPNDNGLTEKCLVTGKRWHYKFVGWTCSLWLVKQNAALQNNQLLDDIQALGEDNARLRAEIERLGRRMSKPLCHDCNQRKLRNQHMSGNHEYVCPITHISWIECGGRDRFCSLPEPFCYAPEMYDILVRCDKLLKIMDAVEGD